MDKDTTDIELILINSNDALTIHSNKNILEGSSNYFHNLFNFGKEKNYSSITINVCNTKIAYDIILLLNNQNPIYYNDSTKYLLEMFQCRSFFCLDNDVKLLYDINVPVEELDLFIQIIEEFDYKNDQNLIRTIKKNIPLDYDLDNFSKEFLNSLNEDFLVVSGGFTGSIKIWNAETNQLLNTLVEKNIVSSYGISCVHDVSFSYDNLKIVSAHHDNRIRIWNTQTGNLINTLIGHKKSVYGVTFSSDDLKIVSGSADRTIKIWDGQSDILLKTLIGHADSVMSVALSADNLKIVSASADTTIKIWDTLTGKLLNTLIGHTMLVESVAFSSDNLKIVSGGCPATINIWDVYSGELLNTLTDHQNFVTCVAFSSDNLKIVSGSWDKTIKMWDARSGQLMNTLTNNSIVYSVAFSPDNLKIISGNYDNTTKIWDTQTGELLNTLNGHNNAVYAVAFSHSPNYSINNKIKKYLKNHSEKYK